MVNLITKTPTDKPELSFLFNTNSGKGFDANGFYSEKWKEFGATVFTSYNYNSAFDPAGNGLTAIPNGVGPTVTVFSTVLSNPLITLTVESLALVT